ncbi:hypothetical protein D1872_265820 [compost metagenome]
MDVNIPRCSEGTSGLHPFPEMPLVQLLYRSEKSIGVIGYTSCTQRQLHIYSLLLILQMKGELLQFL